MPNIFWSDTIDGRRYSVTLESGLHDEGVWTLRHTTGDTGGVVGTYRSLPLAKAAAYAHAKSVPSNGVAPLPGRMALAPLNPYAETAKPAFQAVTVNATRVWSLTNGERTYKAERQNIDGRWRLSWTTPNSVGGMSQPYPTLEDAQAAAIEHARGTQIKHDTATAADVMQVYGIPAGSLGEVWSGTFHGRTYVIVGISNADEAHRFRLYEGPGRTFVGSYPTLSSAKGAMALRSATMAGKEAQAARTTTLVKPREPIMSDSRTLADLQKLLGDPRETVHVGGYVSVPPGGLPDVTRSRAHWSDTKIEPAVRIDASTLTTDKLAVDATVMGQDTLHSWRQDSNGDVSRTTYIEGGKITVDRPLTITPGSISVNTLPGQHPDDEAVDRFAKAMKDKLRQARAKGRSGWDDPQRCSTTYLADLFFEHLFKTNAGNLVDLANLLMMLHQRDAEAMILETVGYDHVTPNDAVDHACDEAVKAALRNHANRILEDLRHREEGMTSTEADQTP